MQTDNRIILIPPGKSNACTHEGCIQEWGRKFGRVWDSEPLAGSPRLSQDRRPASPAKRGAFCFPAKGSRTTMFQETVGPAGHPQGEHAPKPWEEQPGEPPEQYGWFKIYITLPVPWRLVRVAQFAAMNPASSWSRKGPWLWSRSRTIRQMKYACIGMAVMKRPQVPAAILRKTADAPALSSVTAPACALGKGCFGSLSLPASNLSRAHVAAATEEIHHYNRHARRFQKEIA